MKLNKYLIIFSILVVAAIVSGVVYQPIDARAILTEDKTVMHFGSDLNEEGTNDFNLKYPNRTSEKFGKDFKMMRSDNTKLELTFKFEPKKAGLSERTANVNGAIRIDGRAYGFAGIGIFEPFITPDTNETLYVGSIEGKLLGVKMSVQEPKFEDYDDKNSHWFVVFNPDTNKIHTTAGVGFQEHTGMLVFGDNLMNKERWDAFYKQVDERNQLNNASENEEVR